MECVGLFAMTSSNIGKVAAKLYRKRACLSAGESGFSGKTMLLPPDKFLQIVEATPLVSVDLIIRNAAGEILLGKRNNPPAQGFWFVPGGRIRKNEKIPQALQRVCQAELNAKIAEATLLGVYDHLYDDNFLQQPGVSTHYVVLGFECALEAGHTVRPDPQHSEMEWWSVDRLLASPLVHENTRRYFNSAARTFRF
jgi:colanic acid biosynthesis protein WcaH